MFYRWRKCRADARGDGGDHWAESFCLATAFLAGRFEEPVLRLDNGGARDTPPSVVRAAAIEALPLSTSMSTRPSQEEETCWSLGIIPHCNSAAKSSSSITSCAMTCRRADSPDASITLARSS